MFWHNFSSETQVRCALPISSLYLYVNPALLANKSVLELGSGTGFLGLIAADIQVGHRGTTSPVLYLTDVNEGVLKRCHENMQLPCSRSVAHPASGASNFCQTNLLDMRICSSSRWAGSMHSKGTVFAISSHLWTTLARIWYLGPTL